MPIRFLRGRLTERPYVRAVLANTGWLLLDRVLRILLGLLVGAWVARHLGPALYGHLAFSLALLSVFQIGVTLGADGIVVREISQHPERSHQVLGSALLMRLLAGVLGWGAMCLLVRLSYGVGSIELSLVAIMGAGLIFQSADVIDLWFQSQVQSRLSVFSKAIGYCGASLIKVILILCAAPLWMFAAAFFADMLLAALALCAVYKKCPVGNKWAWDGRFALSMLREAWPVLISAIALACFARVDQVLLKYLASEQDLGLYSAVLPFSLAWQMLPMTVYSSLLPRMLSLRQQDQEAYRRNLQRIFVLMVWGGAASALLTALLSNWIVALLLGDGYQAAAGILAIYSFSNIFLFVGIAHSISILAEKTPNIALFKTLTGLVVSVLLNSLAIPLWGGVGAAWVAVLAGLCSMVLLNALIDRPVFVMQVRAIFPVFLLRRIFSA
jgi:O-antigen/teichoic acid export membrane protein